MATDAIPVDRTTLCVTLKSGQAVLVGTSRVAVETTDRKPGKVIARITADRDVRILREELLTRNKPQGENP